MPVDADNAAVFITLGDEPNPDIGGGLPIQLGGEVGLNDIGCTARAALDLVQEIRVDRRESGPAQVASAEGIFLFADKCAKGAIGKQEGSVGVE